MLRAGSLHQGLIVGALHAAIFGVLVMPAWLSVGRSVSDYVGGSR